MGEVDIVRLFARFDEDDTLVQILDDHVRREQIELSVRQRREEAVGLWRRSGVLWHCGSRPIGRADPR
jgi:hypothetical protein